MQKNLILAYFVAVFACHNRVQQFAGRIGRRHDRHIHDLWRPAEQAAFQSVVDGFHATTSEVRVEMIKMPDKFDYMTRLTSDFAAGTPPDVFLLNYRRI